MLLPPSCILSSSVLNIGRQPVASGGSGDIYQGVLNGSTVCVKRIRVYSKEGPEKSTKVRYRRHHFPCLPLLTSAQTLFQEAIVWKSLEHQNIIPLLGITPSPLQLISEWMPGGDLTGHIKKYPDADRMSLVGVTFATFDPTLTPVTSYLMSLTALTISTPATSFMAILRG